MATLDDSKVDQPYFYNLSFFILSLLHGCATHTEVPKVLWVLHAVRGLAFRGIRVYLLFS